MPSRGRITLVPLPAKSREVVGTTVSLYSGAGGLDLGFAAAGFSPIWANDIDPLAVATYNGVFGDHKAYAGAHEERENRPPPTHERIVLPLGAPPGHRRAGGVQR